MAIAEPTLHLSQKPCAALKGVGPAVAEKLAKCHIFTWQDLLFHLPYRYEDRTRLTPIRQARVGTHVLIEGEIVQAQKQFRGKTRLLCSLGDRSGVINLRFFYVNRAQIESFAPGVRVRCFGELRFGPQGVEIVHPEYQVLRENKVLPLDDCLTPVYPTTDGLHQATFRRLIGQVLLAVDQRALIDELIPEDLLSAMNLPSLRSALLTLHRPDASDSQQDLMTGKHPAFARLAFEELLAHRLSLWKMRASVQQHEARVLPNTNTLTTDFLKSLPFTLTAAQQRVAKEVAADLAQSRPMMRLVQGDVGSGKTVVAALAALQAVESGCQVALMAPTDILAEQHHQNFRGWLADLNVPVIFLSGKLGAKAKREATAAIAVTEGAVVIGTHALFQKDVVFLKLGLVIIDEQHRFGVDQRLKLREKGGDLHPHQLIMTATPIPRTLAMTAFADLDNSIIDELPPGRTPVKTVLMSRDKRAEVLARIGQQVASGSQVYWVCTLIEESEVLQCQAAEASFADLKEALPQLNIALVHGRLKAAEKESVMAKFKAGEVDLLVATTVIEVGVDVPNASIMIIENPERLGLSQLHQLRGRVGRGTAKSYCVLMYESPLSQLAKERLTIMRDYNDGFVLAEKDLALRGAGEVLGTRQTGLADFKIADIVRDQRLLSDVASTAKLIWDAHGGNIAALIDRWLGDKTQYGRV